MILRAWEIDNDGRGPNTVEVYDEDPTNPPVTSFDIGDLDGWVTQILAENPGIVIEFYSVEGFYANGEEPPPTPTWTRTAPGTPSD